MFFEIKLILIISIKNLLDGEKKKKRSDTFLFEVQNY